MNPLTTADPHRGDAHRSAPSGQPADRVVRMLHGAALRHLDRALAADPRGDDFVEGLSRADRVVTELRRTLERVSTPALAGALEQLYLKCEERIDRALVDRGHGPAREARAVLGRLQQGWVALETEGGAAWTAGASSST